MKINYTTAATATGGRNGHVRTDDGRLDLKLAMPTSMGGDGTASNPEQLFAAGYAACFETAVQFVADQQGHQLQSTEVTASVALGVNDDGSFGLEVDLEVRVNGIEGEALDAVIQEADRLCPYSNAVRGNIPVRISIR